jgi:phage terminase large subunit-like protein
MKESREGPPEEIHMEGMTFHAEDGRL